MTIRKQPADFIVREVLAADLLRAATPDRGRKPHALYELQKESLTTPDAVRALARALRVRERDVSYAGLKDRHALTLQHVTVAAPPGPGPAKLVDGPGWSARLLGWIERPLAAAAIDHNDFQIVVRDLTPAGAAEMGRRASLLRCAEDDRADRLLLVNYFGDQRFGSARHGRGFAALHAVRGDFETALRLAIATPARKDTGLRRRFTRLAAERWGDWPGLASDLPPCPERRAIERLAAGAAFDEALGALPAFLRTMLVESYQSHLWNDTARRLVRGLGGSVITAEDPFGELLFPSPDSVPPSLRTLSLPMPAPGVTLAEPWKPAAEETLRAEGITLESLRPPRSAGLAFGAADRPLFVQVSGMTLAPAEPDDLAASSARLKRTVRFGLPRGAYATVILRALGQ